MPHSVGRTVIIHKDDFAYNSHPSIAVLDNGEWLAVFGSSRRREPKQHPPGDPLFRNLLVRTADRGATWSEPAFVPDFDWYGVECPGIAQLANGTVVLTQFPLRLVPAGTGPAAPGRGRADLPVAAGAGARRLDRGVHRRRLGAFAAHLGARLPRALRPPQHGPRPQLRHGEDRLCVLPRRLYPHRGGGAGGRTGGLRGHRAPSAAAEGGHVPGHLRQRWPRLGPARADGAVARAGLRRARLGGGGRG